MLKGNRPVKAMRQLAELHLFSSIFSLPLKTEPLVPEDFERCAVSFCHVVPRSTSKVLLKMSAFQMFC